MTDLRTQLQDTLGGAYTVERELGGGGMSRVFVADEKALGRKVVVKVLPPELTAGVNVDRFKREIQVAARLQHAHIVPVLTAGDLASSRNDSGVPYYTMPFVEGESLRARLARTGPLPIHEAIGVLRDVAKALAYAHEHGVVHRDIKPDNVMLAGGSAVVVDFGIAKAISASRTAAAGATLTQIGTSIGTPTYMAPEQAAGDPATDHRADLYAFGCMAFEVFTGRPPFIEASPHRLLAAHMVEKPEAVASFRPDMPASVATLVMQCLEKDVDKRPASAAEAVHTLDTVTSGGAMPAMPSILIGGPGMLRRALLLYAASFVVVAIVAKAAIVAIGLPEWVFAGSLIVMALGLPVILFTGYVHHTTRRMFSTTPRLTPGGTPSVAHGTMQTLALKASPHLSWRRAATGGVYAVAAFIFLVGAFMALRALGIGPAGSLLAAGKLSARDAVLVTDFKVTNADTSLGRVLSDATKTQLAESSVITLLSPEGVANALRRMQRPVNTTLDLPLARELATRNGIKAIVDGEINGLGASGFIVTLKLVTTDSAKELASFRQTASDARGLIEALDKLSRQLRGKMGESLRAVRAAPALEQATTGSLEALRKYTEGSRAENLEGNRPRAIQLLQEAVAIDPGFAEAWRKLGMVLNNAGHPRSAVDSAFLKAYRLRERLPESARDFIAGGYYSYGPGRDRAKAIEAYEAMLRRGDTARAANNLALLLASRREFARAEALLLANERAMPGGYRGVFTILTGAQLSQRKFASADSVRTAGLARFPDFAILKIQVLIVAYLKGDTGRYRHGIDSVYATGDSVERVWARARLANDALLRGRLGEYQRLVNLERADVPDPSARQQLNWATADAYADGQIRGRGVDVAKRLDAALTKLTLRNLPESERPYFAVALAYTSAGRPDRARTILAQYDAEVKDTALRRDQLPARSRLLGEILLAENKATHAVAEFRRSDMRPDGPAHQCVACLAIDLSRAFDKAQDIDSAITYYERVANEYSFERLFFDSHFLPRSLRRLGELYEEKGDRTKAAAYFQKFVNLWKNADPELQPQVAEVRRRLSRLSDIDGPATR